MPLGAEVSKTIVARVFLALIGFLGTIVFARVLGPTRFGGYYLLLTIVMIVDRPFRGWLGGVEKRFSEFGARRGEFVGSAMGFNLVGLLLVGALAFLFESRLVALTGIDGAGHLFLLLLGTLVFFYPFEQLVAATGRVALTNWVDALRSVLTLAFQLVLVLSGLGAAGMAYGLGGATLVAAGVNAFLLRVRPIRPGLETLRSVASFAKYAIPTSLVGKTYSRLDTLLIGFLLTPAIVGEYEVALKLTIPAIFVSNSIRQAMFPKVSNLHSRGKDIVPVINNSRAFASIVAIPLFFGALALTDRLVVTIYGPDYRAAAALLVGITLYRIIDTQSQIYIRTLEAIDRPRVVFQVSAVTLVFNVALGYVLLLEYGAIGAVVATVLAELLRYTALVYLTRKVIEELSFVTRDLLHQFVAGALMFVVVFQLERVVVSWSWYVLLAVVGIGASVYFLGLLAISRKLRVTARGILQDLRAGYVT